LPREEAVVNVYATITVIVSNSSTIAF